MKFKAIVEGRTRMWQEKASTLDGEVWFCIGLGARGVLRDIRPGRENQLYRN